MAMGSWDNMQGSLHDYGLLGQHADLPLWLLALGTASRTSVMATSSRKNMQTPYMATSSWNNMQDSLFGYKVLGQHAGLPLMGQYSWRKKYSAFAAKSGILSVHYLRTHM